MTFATNGKLVANWVQWGVLSTKRGGWVDKVLNILVLSTGMGVSVDNRVGGNFYISAIFLPVSNAFCEFLQHLRCVHVAAWTTVDDDYLFNILWFFLLLEIFMPLPYKWNYLILYTLHILLVTVQTF